MKTKTIWIFLLLYSTLLMQAEENLHYIAKQPSIVAAEQQAIHMLEERGGASSFGYFDLERQHGAIPMLHSIFAVYSYLQGGRERLLVAVSSNPAKHNEYRASVSKLSFFIFEKDNGQWKLKYDQIASSEYGHFGHPPEQKDVRFVQIGTDAYALRIDNFMATQGYGEGHTSLYLVGEEGIHEIFSGFTSGDNGGTEKHDTSWKTDISFDKKGTPLFTLVAHTTGIIDGKRVNKTETYRYDGNQYKKIKRGKKKICTYYTVFGVSQLNIRNRPGKPSKVIDRITRGETVCIFEFRGKWGKSRRGWISGKYLHKDPEKNTKLYADMDNDGRVERLQWEYAGQFEDGTYFRLKLYDDNGELLWSGPKKTPYASLVPLLQYGNYLPVVFTDIDKDGTVELIMETGPEEPIPAVYEIYRWNGNVFSPLHKDRLELVWSDAPYGKRLKWRKADSVKPRNALKEWWVIGLEQTNTDTFTAEIVGVKYKGRAYPEPHIFFHKRARIRFQKGGAVIAGWIR